MSSFLFRFEKFIRKTIGYLIMIMFISYKDKKVLLAYSKTNKTKI